jgi:hypothetical protein
MRHIAPLMLAGFGAGLFAAQMPSPIMALGGLITLFGIALQGLHLHLRLALTGGRVLDLSHRPAAAGPVYTPAFVGVAFGGGISLAPLGPCIALASLGAVALALASLTYRIDQPGRHPAR